MTRARLAIVFLAACSNPIPVHPTTATAPLSCHLEADGLACNANNPEVVDQQLCAEVYIGVRETGALLTPNPALPYSPFLKVCSPALGPGESTRFTRSVAFSPTAACGPALDGCAIELVNAGDAPDRKPAIAFARALEQASPVPGLEQPTIRECEALVDHWHAGGDADTAVLLCVGLPRAKFDCLRTSTNDEQMVACL